MLRTMSGIELNLKDGMLAVQKQRRRKKVGSPYTQSKLDKKLLRRILLCHPSDTDELLPVIQKLFPQTSPELRSKLEPHDYIVAALGYMAKAFIKHSPVLIICPQEGDEVDMKPEFVELCDVETLYDEVQLRRTCTFALDVRKTTQGLLESYTLHFRATYSFEYTSWLAALQEAMHGCRHLKLTTPKLPRQLTERASTVFSQESMAYSFGRKQTLVQRHSTFDLRVLQGTVKLQQGQAQEHEDCPPVDTSPGVQTHTGDKCTYEGRRDRGFPTSPHAALCRKLEYDGPIQEQGSKRVLTDDERSASEHHLNYPDGEEFSFVSGKHDVINLAAHRWAPARQPPPRVSSRPVRLPSVRRVSWCGAHGEEGLQTLLRDYGLPSTLSSRPPAMTARSMEHEDNGRTPIDQCVTNETVTSVDALSTVAAWGSDAGDIAEAEINEDMVLAPGQLDQPLSKEQQNRDSGIGSSIHSRASVEALRDRAINQANLYATRHMQYFQRESRDQQRIRPSYSNVPRPMSSNDAPLGRAQAFALPDKTDDYSKLNPSFWSNLPGRRSPPPIIATDDVDRTTVWSIQKDRWISRRAI
ncbi:hypothetical protein HDU85_001344 [Gaertneriomyces sp. JEL0708]|nr:hypothetical protein HDU85_001344 [Gaertneriomyces sp. JEL0708]